MRTDGRQPTSSPWPHVASTAPRPTKGDAIVDRITPCAAQPRGGHAHRYKAELADLSGATTDRDYRGQGRRDGLRLAPDRRPGPVRDVLGLLEAADAEPTLDLRLSGSGKAKMAVNGPGSPADVRRGHVNRDRVAVRWRQQGHAHRQARPRCSSTAWTCAPARPAGHRRTRRRRPTWRALRPRHRSPSPVAGPPSQASAAPGQRQHPDLHRHAPTLPARTRCGSATPTPSSRPRPTTTPTRWRGTRTSPSTAGRPARAVPHTFHETSSGRSRCR